MSYYSCPYYFILSYNYLNNINGSNKFNYLMKLINKIFSEEIERCSNCHFSFNTKNLMISRKSHANKHQESVCISGYYPFVPSARFYFAPLRFQNCFLLLGARTTESYERGRDTAKEAFEINDF